MELPIAHHDESGFQVGNIIVKADGILERYPYIRMPNLKRSGPNRPVRGQLDLVPHAYIRSVFGAANPPSGAAADHFQPPQIHEHGVGIPKQNLPKDLVGALTPPLHSGGINLQGFHPEVVEHAAEPGRLLFSQLRTHGFEESGEVPGFQEGFDMGDKSVDILGGGLP